MILSRRTLLAGGLGLGLGAGCGVATGVLPGRTRLATALDDVLPVDAPTGPAGPVRRGAFVSTARRGARVGWLVAYPSDAGQAPLPVAVVLHGQGGDENGMVGLDLPGHLADVVRAGVPPFAIAAVAGGSGYWHARASGEDAGRMVLEEFLPVLAALDGPPLAAGPGHRIGLTGWSMGGYGALLLAERLGASRVGAVAAASPALWRHADQAAPGAFDNAADFARNDVFSGRARLRGVAVRIDCGLGDPFVDASREFAAGVEPAPAGGFGVGGHDGNYWRRIAPAQLRFLGNALGG